MIMRQIFAQEIQPSPLHQWLASLNSPLLVALWYDDVIFQALKQTNANWAVIQGVSQAEKAGQWTLAYDPEGQVVDAGALADIPTLLYQPWGSVTPSENFVISDADLSNC